MPDGKEQFFDYDDGPDLTTRTPTAIGHRRLQRGSAADVGSVGRLVGSRCFWETSAAAGSPGLDDPAGRVNRRQPRITSPPIAMPIKSESDVLDPAGAADIAAE